MKSLITLLICFSSTFCFSMAIDSIPSFDSTLVANRKLIEIATKVDSLESKVNVLSSKVNTYKALVSEQQSQITFYQVLKQDDDKLITLMQEEMKLRTNLYTEMMSDAYKPKNSTIKEVLWFVGGLVVAYTGVSLAAHF